MITIDMLNKMSTGTLVMLCKKLAKEYDADFRVVYPSHGYIYRMLENLLHDFGVHDFFHYFACICHEDEFDIECEYFVYDDCEGLMSFSSEEDFSSFLRSYAMGILDSRYFREDVDPEVIAYIESLVAGWIEN